MAKIRPDTRCPCGSGKRYGKCCIRKRKPRGEVRVAPYTSADRESALRKLAELQDEMLDPDEVAELDGIFWGDLEPPDDPVGLDMSLFAFQAWTYFDAELDDDETLADVALAEPGLLSRGERAFVELARRCPMRPYEVLAVRPGASLTLRDLLDGAVREVRERSGSRSLHRWDVICTRVFSPGASGRPELDGGLFPIPRVRRERLVEQVRAELEASRADEPDAPEHWHHRALVPVYHRTWRTPPSVPELVNYDGEAIVETKVHYEIARGTDAAIIERLDAVSALSREGQPPGRWEWSGVGSSRTDPVVRGWIAIDGERLVLHTNSRERAESGRPMIEAALGDLVAFRASEITDVRSAVERALRGGERVDASPSLPRELRDPAFGAAEAMMQAHYERWIDEPVPMLDGKTPREAAASSSLRSRVAEALKDLDRMYERALEDGQPAFDPSWIREELGVRADLEGDRASPAPLAHETMCELLPELEDVATRIAERVRAESGGALDRVIEERDLRSDLGLERLVREHTRRAARDADSETAATTDALVRAHVALLADFELHRRKVFWVAEPLSWALGATKLDVGGDVLRPPFASFALVFMDRYALGLAERMLSRETAARLRGRMLRVLTAYVTRTREDETGSTLRVTFACDARDGDWPYVVSRNLRIRDDASLDAILRESWPDVPDDDLDALADSVPLRDLLHLVTSAIVYATSADARREERAPVRERRAASLQDAASSSESVYYLPATIDISALRAIQRARRGSGDRAQIHRCLVRGHWRRANPGWKDDRPRWVEPYWRGPSIAAIVERQYRLEP